MEGEKRVSEIPDPFDYKKELTLLAESITACDGEEMMRILDKLGRHIHRLELTVKKQHKKIEQHEKDNEELKRLCKMHYANAQRVMRHELKLEEKVLTTKGTVHGTNEEFELK